MKNEKAFTLIELLAVVVILGILMTIAIPNTIALIDKNKKSTYIENAKTFVSLVQSKAQTDKNLQMPINSSQALIVTLEYLNTNDIDEDPYGDKYDKAGSFVVITMESSKYVYYVHLISCITNSCDRSIYTNWRGINLVELTELNGDNRFQLVKSVGATGDMIDVGSSTNNILKSRSIIINDQNSSS